MPDYDEETDDWYRTIARHSNRIKALETEVAELKETVKALSNHLPPSSLAVGLERLEEKKVA